MNRTRVLASVVLVLLFAVSCRKARPVEAGKPLHRTIDGIEIWVDRSPPQTFTVLITEDATNSLDTAGKRDLLLRGDAAVMDAAARRAKAIGADAALMVTKGPARRELSRMTMFVRYEGTTPVAGPTIRPATRRAP